MNDAGLGDWMRPRGMGEKGVDGERGAMVGQRVGEGPASPLGHFVVVGRNKVSLKFFYGRRHSDRDRAIPYAYR